MHDEITSSYRTCKDLQSLINITYNDVIKPLREAFKNNSKSKIIALEIKDAENKVFEYISSQITTIGNASEEDSKICMKEFPKSEICYRCIGLDDDTIQGLLKIRNISFPDFLGMDSIEVIKLMKIYCVNINELNQIVISLNIIKQNIELLYENSTLIDNTRNLIKLVTRLVDNKSTNDDIGIIGIPSSSEILVYQEMKKENSENSGNSEKTALYGNSVDDLFLHVDNEHLSNCLSNPNQNIDTRRSISDCHPSSIISTKKPVNQETLLKAFKSNTTLSGITCNDDKSYLSTNQLADLNSLSVPNTPNVQKSRSVGGSEEILTDLPNNIVNRSTEFSISPTLHRKNYSRIVGKTKTNQTRNIQLQRSLSHEFDSKNSLNLKENDGNCLSNQQFQPSVFQFNQDNLGVNNYDTVEKERRSSYEEKLMYKSSTISCDFNMLNRPLSPGFSSKIYDMNNGFRLHGKHKFEAENKFPFIVKPPICAVCKTKKFFPKFIYCEYCKIKVHKGCIEGTGQLPCVKNIKSPPADRKNSENSIANACAVFQGSDSNSNSTPESPLNIESGYNSAVNNHISPRHPNKLLKTQKFDFSKIDEADSQKNLNVIKICQENTEVAKNDNNSKTLESNKLNQNLIQRFESTESQDESSHLSRTNSISVALKEWEIPYKNLELGELLGKGSFWTVFKGKWHGEVAVKIMNIDPQDENDACMAAFKSEVGALHKTRHENLVLFMGACMEPPKLAIVTQLSQGETLFYQLHSRHLSIPVIRAINIASQVAKGMGYLHAKDILHKDLKSRNIFIESNSKVVISDFGLFDFVRMCKQAISGSYLRIPPGWLCYLAPELIRKLNLNSIFSNNSSEDLPFTKSSDIYAFGTIWYEILNSKWPFEGLPSEAIIYRVGKGIKESLKIVHAKEFKDLLIQCWSSKADNRPAFTNIVQILEKLPKLQRSPSYPVKSVSVVRSHDNLIT